MAGTSRFSCFALTAFFRQASRTTVRPVLITSSGTPSFSSCRLFITHRRFCFLFRFENLVLVALALERTTKQTWDFNSRKMLNATKRESLQDRYFNGHTTGIRVTVVDPTLLSLRRLPRPSRHPNRHPRPSLRHHPSLHQSSPNPEAPAWLYRCLYVFSGGQPGRKDLLH